MEIVSIRDQRSPILIATFVDGYAAGWRFAVPEVFRDSLDIKLTPTKIGDKTINLYTQGKQFSFNQGAVLYDTRKAYDLEWGEALKHLKLSVQVIAVAPSDYVTSEIIETTSKKVEIQTQKKTKSGLSEPKKEVVDGLQITKQRMEYGKIKFTLFRPTKDKSSVEELEIIECDQEEFVSFLQTGFIISKENKRRDLFKEYLR
jgi:hypothetical protein